LANAVSVADEPIGTPFQVTAIASELDVTAVELYVGLTVPGPQKPVVTGTPIGCDGGDPP
jgi:hypothetical protein